VGSQKLYYGFTAAYSYVKYGKKKLIWDTLLLAQLVEALRYKPESRGFNSRWHH
jgi:hypothetical protein